MADEDPKLQAVADAITDALADYELGSVLGAVSDALVAAYDQLPREERAELDEVLLAELARLSGQSDVAGDDHGD